jgi:hypothetical protein
MNFEGNTWEIYNAVAMHTVAYEYNFSIVCGHHMHKSYQVSNQMNGDRTFWIILV